MESRSDMRTLPAAAPSAPAGAAIADAPRRVLRNTYALLGLNLAFAAVVGAATAALSVPAPGLLITLGAWFGLLFLISKFRDRAASVWLTFALTGVMGWTLGPLVSRVAALPGGEQAVTLALGTTAAVFFGMSAIALTTKRDFSRMGGFLIAGTLVAFVAGLAAVFFEIPALSLAVAAMFALLSSGLILWETQNIVRGGETNYVMATVSLFASIFNLFASLLQLFGFAGSND